MFWIGQLRQSHDTWSTLENDAVAVKVDAQNVLVVRVKLELGPSHALQGVFVGQGGGEGHIFGLAVVVRNHEAQGTGVQLLGVPVDWVLGIT